MNSAEFHKTSPSTNCDQLDFLSGIKRTELVVVSGLHLNRMECLCVCVCVCVCVVGGGGGVKYKVAVRKQYRKPTFTSFFMKNAIGL